ncbi:MAG: hypothetical protein ACFFDN_05565 [Candidatus Hodarchaeota archaeon]
MKGLFLCKFDEKKGYVPIKPIFIDEKKYKNDDKLLTEIARNAIGFGSQLEFNSFSLSGVNCISQRFSISLAEARGGSETYALAIISDEEEEIMSYKPALNKTVEYLKNWEDVKDKLASLYDAIKHPEQALSFTEEETNEVQTYSPSVFSDDSFSIKDKSHFTSGYSLGRNLIMSIGSSIILVTVLLVFLYSRPFETFDFWKYAYTNILMFLVGLLTYSAINRKRFLTIIQEIFIFLLFIIPFYAIFYRDIIFDIIHYWIYLTSFIAAIFICGGLDNKGKIDRVSALILIFVILLILLSTMVYLNSSGFQFFL